ncbi:MAG: PQQ-binding-like beta-propeller repeat protein, partial [Gammaproteobacteria bacterium]
PVFRAGADTWIPGSYDPELDTFYIGTSQAKPWVAASRGMTPDDKALYTNSTLALAPKTGKIKWFFQHVPGETIDMDIVFERILADVNGEKFLLTIGKDGILWKLNRENGEYVALKQTLYQNIYKKIDKENGRVFYRDDILAIGIDEPFTACPGIYGGHNWQSASYDPSNQLITIPLFNLCSDMVGRHVEREEGAGGYGGDSKTYKMSGIGNKVSKLVSINIDSMETVWEFEQEAMFLTAALSTAGGITFIGDLDRKFKAFETTTGKVLWEAVLSSPLHGYPISYGVNGQQYVAVMTGMGVFKALTAILSPDIYQPEGGNVIYVFELPRD